MTDLVKNMIAECETVSKNEINDEEQIEAIVAGLNSDLHLILRALERAGAPTDPLKELESRASSFKALSFARA